MGDALNSSCLAGFSHLYMLGKEWHMRVTILLLIFLIIPQGLRADTLKKSHHRKKAKVAYIQRSKQMDTKGRYKLISYYKNGKLKHRYLDTHPGQESKQDLEREVVARSPANQNKQNVPDELKLEQELDSKVDTPN
jgi:hypothetical protein